MSDIFMLIEKAEGGDKLTNGASSKESIGSFSKKGHEDEVYVLSYSHKVILPTDPRSGQITGSRKHEHLEIQKLTDKSTPVLYDLLRNSETFSVSMEFYRNSGESGGQSELYFSVTLTDAKIVSIQMEAPDILNVTIENHLPREVVKFAYDGIKWDNVKCSTTSQDSWSDSLA